ncbi:TetR/AcrR family transcriptional regulator [Streptomyces longisporoflavus]|uniref:TetR/AcrR family transcriptional regulator n=1 Tax=Streptomyces longisporoflavus TaxID=28044 RepID=UPI00167E31A5|nr:TetR/AcrR family transcriptional regulator [Streptomyces longisporoflavus]
MGHREQLMTGAKRCLQERGYARTTSRDIAAAANNAPVGTINYHYGSKEALLNAALLETLMEWGTAVMGTPVGAEGDAPEQSEQSEQSARPDGPEPLERMWARIIGSSATDRPMLVASTEAFTQAERAPEIREQIAAAYERARPEMAARLHGIDADDDPETARAVGSVHMALVAGLTQQWLIDPDYAPSASDVAAGLRVIARRLEEEAGPTPAAD